MFSVKRRITVGVILALSLLSLVLVACTPEEVEAFKKGYCKQNPQVSWCQSTTTVRPTTTTVPGEVRPVGAPSGVGSLVFRDEFNDSTVDPAVWAKSWFSPSGGFSPPINGSEDNCFHTDNAFESNGSLHLRATATSDSRCRKRDGSQAGTAGGIVSSNLQDGVPGGHEFTYGYIEVRAQLPGAVNWPAIWTNGHHGDHPDRGELDIMELLSGRRPCANIHYTTLESGSQCASSFLSGWHTYAMYWTPDFIEFRYDGQVVGRRFGVEMPHIQYIVLNMATNDSYSNGRVNNVEMLVDYVRLWRV